MTLPARSQARSPDPAPRAPRWRLLRRLSTIAGGHSLYAAFNWSFDNLLYVYAVHRLGLLAGGALMTVLAGIQCAATLLLYERMRIDWIGVGGLATLADAENPRWWQRLLRRAMRKGGVVLFLALCILQDAFIATVWFRRGRFDGLTARDWRIFAAAVLVSNLYWTLRSGAVAALLAGAWRWLHPD